MLSVVHIEATSQVNDRYDFTSKVNDSFNMSVAPDWMLGLLFGLGGMAGMYCGARCQKYVPAKYIKWMLALVIIGTALKYLIDYLA